MRGLRCGVAISSMRRRFAHRPARQIDALAFCDSECRADQRKHFSTRPSDCGLVSGQPAPNLQALLDTVHGREAERRGRRRPTLRALPRWRAIRRAHGVPGRVSRARRYADRRARDDALADWLSERGARLVVLAGYMELLGERFPGALPGRRDQRPSLAAAGLSRAAGDRAGAGLRGQGLRRDRPLRRRRRRHRPGDPAGAVELPEARDPDEVHAALRPLEHALLPEAVRLFARGALRARPENPRRVLVARLDEALSAARRRLDVADAGSSAPPRRGAGAPGAAVGLRQGRDRRFRARPAPSSAWSSSPPAAPRASSPAPGSRCARSRTSPASPR